jgi:glutamyl-Q tRNA(Asp) synthetase
MTPVFRFAPSPNGDLHLGHALSALLNFEVAKASNGRFLLRIEDIDPARCRPEYEAGIYEDLTWLGLTWEEPVRRQSEHVGEYRAALEGLKARGLVYPAFLSRAEVKARVQAFEADGGTWPRDPDQTPLYPTEERGLDPEIASRRIAGGERHMWRLDVERAMAAVAFLATPPSALPGISPSRGENGKTLAPSPKLTSSAGHATLRVSERVPHPLSPLEGEMPGRAEGGNPAYNATKPPLTWTETGTGIQQTIPADPSVWGDVVLWRWDAPSSYHLSVVLDDALQGITHVVRGLDLYHTTPVHRLLQGLLGLPQPVYHHHRLLMDDQGEKLSKSLGSTGLRALREAGATPSEIRRRIGIDRLIA